MTDQCKKCGGPVGSKKCKGMCNRCYQQERKAQRRAGPAICDDHRGPTLGPPEREDDDCEFVDPAVRRGKLERVIAVLRTIELGGFDGKLLAAALSELEEICTSTDARLR